LLRTLLPSPETTVDPPHVMQRYLLPSILLILLLAACNGEPQAKTTVPNDADRQIRDLVAALAPAPASANSAVQNDWFNRFREVSDRIRTAGPAVGQAALDKFHESDDEPLAMRRGLLRAAGYNLPVETAPLLEAIFEQYGEDLGLRTAAIEMLSETSPADAIRLIQPIIEKRRPGKTYPEAERLVECYAKAALALELGKEAQLVLSSYATDLFLDQTGRVMAIKALADYPGSHTRETLRTVLVESTGNGYLRRISVKSLVKLAEVDPETNTVLCDLINEVMTKEVDLNFQQHLINILEKHCQ